MYVHVYMYRCPESYIGIHLMIILYTCPSQGSSYAVICNHNPITQSLTACFKHTFQFECVHAGVPMLFYNIHVAWPTNRTTTQTQQLLKEWSFLLRGSGTTTNSTYSKYMRHSPQASNSRDVSDQAFHDLQGFRPFNNLHGYYCMCNINATGKACKWG